MGGETVLWSPHLFPRNQMGGANDVEWSGEDLQKSVWICNCTRHAGASADSDPIVVLEIKPIYLRVLTYDAVQYICVFHLLLYFTSLNIFGRGYFSSYGLCFLLKNFQEQNHIPGYLMKFSTRAYFLSFLKPGNLTSTANIACTFWDFYSFSFWRNRMLNLTLWSETF